MALPGKGKSFNAFQREDAYCRQYADRDIGYMQPGQAATNAGLGSAVVGTALGAAAGAAIGSVSGNMGAGAAIGGAAGLLGGSAIGAGNAQASAEGLQQRYNIAYTQCMYAQGNTVVARPPGPYGGYGGYGYPGPGYGYPGPAYGPYYYGPGYAPY
ncbi:MAG: glycine zipper family protein [Rhodospirillales bacterium]|nr:glycine zipper family protein [Rhodospirillales bacterium]